MADFEFLKKLFPPTDFTNSDHEQIFSCFSEVSFPKNQFLLKEGTTENLYWLMEKGYARSYVTDLSGNDITTSFYASGDVVIDWSSFFLRAATRENIQTLTDCVCWQIGYQDFQKLFHGMENFREYGRRRLVGSYFSLKKHSVSLIADEARERYKNLVAEKPDIIQNVSQQHIASYLGITKFSLSRLRKELAQAK